jgi:hypothetical protein
VFVGRERELAKLFEALEGSFAGHGRLILLSGEPGIGKSRLADELGAEAGRKDAAVILGRCWEAGGALRTGLGCRRCERISVNFALLACARLSVSREPSSLGFSQSSRRCSRTCRRRQRSILIPTVFACFGR